MNKAEYLAYLDNRAAEEAKWADRLKHDHDERIGHLSAAWAFRVARLCAEELDDLEAPRCLCRHDYKCVRHRILESATKAVEDNQSCIRGPENG